MDLTELLVICSRMRGSSDAHTHNPCSPPVEQLMLHSSGSWAAHQRILWSPSQLQGITSFCAQAEGWFCFHLCHQHHHSPVPVEIHPSSCAWWSPQSSSTAENPQSRGCSGGAEGRGQPSLALSHCTQTRGTAPTQHCPQSERGLEKSGCWLWKKGLLW